MKYLSGHQRLVCSHVMDVLNDMLDISRMESGLFTPQNQVVDLYSLCQKAAKLQVNNNQYSHI
jgi:signal transduction histidine kinase